MRLQIALWLTTAAITGALVMGLELVAFRLYAPYFGYTIYVWGSMISVVMVALALGYAIGGHLADRSRSDVPLYSLILSSALYQLLILLTIRVFLPSLADRGEFLGTVLATLVIFAPPMTALATAGPFVIRLMARADRIGATAGYVYALSTTGSIVGILGTTFFLVPRFGTQTTLSVICAASAVLGLVGLAHRKRIALLALLPLLGLAFRPDLEWSTGTIWVGESAYNLVRVTRVEDRLVLRLNDERAVQTIRHETKGWTGRYYDNFALGPLLVPARRVLVLGMGAGGSITSTRAVAPNVEIDAVEIDGKVIEAAVRFFGISLTDPRLRIHKADARPWLRQSGRIYDVVHADLYHGGPYVPFYLVTVEFFEQVRSRMSDDAVLMVNVLDAGRERELLNSIGVTLKQVFPAVAVLSRMDGNHLLLAFTRDRDAASVRDTLPQVKSEHPVMDLIGRARRAIVDLSPSPRARVLTDDHAPVEGMTRRMLAEHTRHQNVESAHSAGP
jgi:predicted membrane-bound spermidine synthase